MLNTPHSPSMNAPPTLADGAMGPDMECKHEQLLSSRRSVLTYLPHFLLTEGKGPAGASPRQIQFRCHHARHLRRVIIFASSAETSTIFGRNVLTSNLGVVQHADRKLTWFAVVRKDRRDQRSDRTDGTRYLKQKKRNHREGVYRVRKQRSKRTGWRRYEWVFTPL